MNVAVGKIGKKFYFSSKKWTINSGDSEVTSTLITLAALNKNINFYIIGLNDLDSFSKEQRKEFFPNENVFNVWDTYTKSDDRTEFVINFFRKNNIEINFGFLHAGPVSQVNIPEKSYTLKSKEIAKVINMSALYCAPVIHYLNVSNIPYVVLGEDPRYFPLSARDLFNRPIGYYATYNTSCKTKYANGYLSTEIIEKNEEIKNIFYDRFFLVSEDFNKIGDYKKYNKDILIDIYTNGNGSTGVKKFKIINDYMSTFKDMKVYGKWNDNIVSSPNYLDVPMIDIVDKLYRTKYTLMFHFEEGYPSSKFWKMIYFGILPFYHPNMDTQRHQPVHEYLRVKSKKEFLEKIEYLEKNPDFYKEIQDYHLSQFKKEYFDGCFLNEKFHEIVSSKVRYKRETDSVDFYKESVLLKKADTNIFGD